MKKFNLKFVITVVTGVTILTFYACKRTLDQAPLGVISPVTLANKAGVDGLLIGAYSILDGVRDDGAGDRGAASNWLFGGVAAGDAYKGSQPSDGGATALPIGNYTYDPSSIYIAQRYSVLFDGVNRANDVITTIPTAKDMTEAEAKEKTGEARFLRGFYYLELRKQYGKVPYIDESTKDFNQPNNVEIWPKIEADLQFGINNMSEIQPQRGRANKWAAMAYLAKTYMFEHKFDIALPLFHQLISNGVTAGGQKYALTAVFQQNFSPEPSQKNSSESVFAAQTSVNDGSKGTNGNRGDILNFPYSGSSPGGCCGWDNPSQSLANSYKTDSNGLPLFDSYNTGANISNPSLGAVWNGSVDPRIDITMGRIGMPYLDWGNMQSDWIRDPTDGVFSPRKNVYALSEQGTLTDKTPGVWFAGQTTSNNVNLMRFADILLLAAECEIEASGGSFAVAENNVNMVRARASNPAGWVYRNSTYSAVSSTYVINNMPADNYLVNPYPTGSFADKVYARKAIRFERKIELGMEGMRWYDLQRWDGASVSDPITNSDGSMATEINAFFTRDVRINSQLQGAKFTPKKNEYWAIPQAEIDKSRALGVGQLTQNNGY